MGAYLSSPQLAGGVTGSLPSTSYAYNPTNAANFGVDAYCRGYEDQGGQVTPYLVRPAAPTITCSPLVAYETRQSVLCPVKATDLAPGLYTISLSAYASTTTTEVGGDIVWTVDTDSSPNTLTHVADLTFSIVEPQGTQVQAATTVTVTPTETASTTVISGVSEISATSTLTIPGSTITLTVFSTTTIATSSSLSTSSSTSIVTVTQTCTPATPRCRSNNCLRALKGKPASASAFCSQYTTTTGLPIATYLTACGGIPTSVSSACSCFATGGVIVRGVGYVAYSPPDFTYTNAAVSGTSTVSSGPITTVTDGPIPSATTTDADSTILDGTTTITESDATTTITLFTSSAVNVVTSTSTFTPASCM